MNNLKDVLENNFNKNIKENLLIRRAYGEIVNDKIISVTRDIFYKNNVLYIFVKDTMWATQLMQYKHTILKRYKKINSAIKEVQIKVSFEEQEAVQPKKIPKKRKDISQLLPEINNCDIKFREKLKRIIMNTPSTKKHCCMYCGSSIISEKSKFCSLCISHNKALNSKETQSIFKETPWIKYEEIEQNQRKNLNYEGFMQEKRFKINKIRDIIENEYFGIKNDKKPKTEFFKSKIEELVILKLSIEPSELTLKIIENNIPKKWFKLYQS